MEQLARDARITTLYEGTTGIQALDLLGRKIIQLQGVGLRQFLSMVQKFCERHMADAELIEFVLPLAEVTKQWGELTIDLGRRAVADPEEIGAAAVDYLFYSGYAALAYWWAQSVAIADVGSRSAEFKRRKLETARFYFSRLLPRVNQHAAGIRAGVATLYA